MSKIRFPVRMGDIQQDALTRIGAKGVLQRRDLQHRAFGLLPDQVGRKVGLAGQRQTLRASDDPTQANDLLSQRGTSADWQTFALPELTSSAQANLLLLFGPDFAGRIKSKRGLPTELQRYLDTLAKNCLPIGRTTLQKIPSTFGSEAERYFSSGQWLMELAKFVSADEANLASLALIPDFTPLLPTLRKIHALQAISQTEQSQLAKALLSFLSKQNINTIRKLFMGTSSFPCLIRYHVIKQWLQEKIDSTDSTSEAEKNALENTALYLSKSAKNIQNAFQVIQHLEEHFGPIKNEQNPDIRKSWLTAVYATAMHDKAAALLASINSVSKLFRPLNSADPVQLKTCWLKKLVTTARKFKTSETEEIDAYVAKKIVPLLKALAA
ncbi:MAG: hypothetical protein ABIE84_03635 [bacterium]